MKKNNFIFLIILFLLIITIFDCDIPDKPKSYNYNDVKITNNKDDNNEEELNNEPKIEVSDKYTASTSIHIPIEIPLQELKNRLTIYAKNIEYTYSGKNKIGFNVEYPYVYWKKKKVGFVTVKYPVLRWTTKKINLNCKIKIDSKINDVIFKSIEGNDIQILLKVKTDASISDVELLTIKLPVLNESYTIKLLSDNVLKLTGTADLSINNEILADNNNILLNKINHIDYNIDASLFGSSTLGDFVVSLIGTSEYINLLKESAGKQINAAVAEIIETKVKPYVDEVIRDIMQPISINNNSSNIWLTLNSEENKMFNFIISPVTIEGSGDTAVISSNVGIYGKPFFTIGDKPDILPDTVSDFIFTVEDFVDDNFEIGLKTIANKAELNQLILDALMNSDKIKSNNIIINNLSIEYINGIPKIEIDFADIFADKIEIDCQVSYDFQSKKIIVYSANFLESSKNLIDNSEYNFLLYDILKIIESELMFEIPEEFHTLVDSMNTGSLQIDNSDIVINSTINNVKILFIQPDDISSKYLEIIFVINGKFEPVNIYPLIF